MFSLSTLRTASADTLRSRAGQNLSEFMVITVFCFGLGAAVFGLYGTQSTGLSSASQGECIPEPVPDPSNRTFDAKLIANPTMDGLGNVDPDCVDKGNLPAKLSSVYSARAKYVMMPIP